MFVTLDFDHFATDHLVNHFGRKVSLLSVDHFGGNHLVNHFGRKVLQLSVDHFGVNHFRIDHFGVDHFAIDHLNGRSFWWESTVYVSPLETFKKCQKISPAAGSSKSDQISEKEGGHTL